MKKWIKNKLIKFLGIDIMCDKITRNKDAFDFEVNELNQKISHTQESVDVLRRTIENIITLGVDIQSQRHEYNKSWAVICVEGRLDYVKFVDLSNYDVRDISMFLKKYEGSRKVIDSPCRDMMTDEFFKF